MPELDRPQRHGDGLFDRDIAPRLAETARQVLKKTGALRRRQHARGTAHLRELMI
jgi:hypothetical protein